MPITPLIVALVIAQTTPPPAPAEEEEDIMLVDKPEMSRMELQAARFERVVMTVVPNTPELSIARGDTVFLELDIPLMRAPKTTIDGKAGDVRGPKEIRLNPWLEPSPGSDKSMTRMLYAIRVGPTAPLGKQKIAATITAHDRDDGQMIGTKQVAHTIDVKTPETDRDRLALDKRAYLYHQQLALEAYKTLRSLHDYLRLDRVDPPPPAKRISERERPNLETFMIHRLRADIARERLRAYAELPDQKLAEAAVVAIGGLSRKATGPAAKAAIIDGETTAKALELARAALDELRIDEAEGILAKLRKKGSIDRDQLGRVIDLNAAVYAARGKDDEAKEEHGRALCIDPKIDLALTRQPLISVVKRVFERERVAQGACTHRLAVSTISAIRMPTETGVQILVRARFGPDPRELITGGDIEIWGGGGGRLEGQKVRAKHDGSGMGVLEAQFSDQGQLENYGGNLLLSIVVRDVSGVAIADAGVPDPISTQISAAPEMDNIDLPWWAYAVAAGVLVLGTATTVAIVQANRDTGHGIGPITVEF